MRLRGLLIRLLSLALAIFICVRLRQAYGPWSAAIIWAGIMAVVCTISAVLLYRCEIGKVGIANYLAGITLPWGYTLFGGRNLWPVLVASWAGWCLLGVAVMLATHRLPPDAAPRDKAIAGLLLLSWIIDVAAIVRAISSSTRGSTRVPPALVLPLLGLSGLVLASVGFAAWGTSSSGMLVALALAGGPPLLIGGAYGLFVLAMLIFGRNARWN